VSQAGCSAGYVCVCGWVGGGVRVRECESAVTPFAECVVAECEYSSHGLQNCVTRRDYTLYLWDETEAERQRLSQRNQVLTVHTRVHSKQEDRRCRIARQHVLLHTQRG
jgi:hypothetical protein